MFTAGRSVIVTTDEIQKMVGAIQVTNGKVALTSIQFEAFIRIVHLFLLHRCNMHIHGLIISGHAAVLATLLLSILTETTWLPLATLLPGAMLLILFVVQLFRNRIVSWLYKRYELMVVHVVEDGCNSTIEVLGGGN